MLEWKTAIGDAIEFKVVALEKPGHIEDELRRIVPDVVS